MWLTISVLLLATAAFAGDPTRIGQHQMGETFQRWSELEHDEIERACQPPTHRYSASSTPITSGGNILECSQIRGFQKGASGGWVFVTKESRVYVWTFGDGALTEVMISPHDDRVLFFTQEIGFLTEAYGKPVIREVPYQNAFGAHWTASIASWRMPDGTRIKATESNKFTDHGKLRCITIRSAHARQVTPATASNPYATSGQR